MTGPSQLAAQPLGDPSHVHAPSSAPGLTRPVVEAVQQRARESLVHRELVQELHVQHVDQAYGSMEHVDDVGERGSTRPAWFTRMSEVIQRRVVAPVMEQVQTAGRGRTLQSPGASPQSVWHSQPSQPTTPTAPLMPQEVRQAMSSWTARPSLLTPRPRRQAEESSNGSISQEVVMEEVRKQVKAALDERESEMKRLHDENQELRQVITALSQRELQGDDGSGGRPTLMDGSLGPRGAEPRGNPGLEHRDAAAAGRIPPGLSAQSPVPGGEPPGRGASGAPPGLAEFVTHQGEGDGRVVRLLPPAGLSAQSPVPGGNPNEHDDQEGGHRSQSGPTGISGGGEGILHDGGDEPSAGAAQGEDNAMVDHLHLLVQGMRQLQQMQMNRRDPTEAEAVKGSVELQKMPEPGDAAVELNDWMYVTEQMLGALTDNASAWFSQCLQCAREAYSRYQEASALERLSISPILSDSLKDPKWFRLERRVLSLLLAAMPKAVKEDTITHRVENVSGVLYRLHVLYQPGGTLERTAILKHLEGVPGPEDPGEVVAQLRRWRRHLVRAEEMAITLPDASLQLRGLETITAKVLEKFPDVKFRLALAKNDLRLASTPTAETVLKFYQHILAEL